MTVRIAGIAIAKPATLRALVAEYGGTLDDALEAELVVASVGPSDRSTDATICPVLHARFAARIRCDAPVLLVAERVAQSVPSGRRWVHHDAQRVLVGLLRTEEEAPTFREHPSRAWVADGVELPADVRLSPGVVIHPGVVIGRRVSIGANTVIGRRGFGFLEEPRRPEVAATPIPHRAGVRIDDDVEIGALCSIDAGVLSPTSIGAGSLLDSHVHVGHGVTIGAGVRIAAQVGLAGSVVIEDDVRIGGQAGFADHVHVGRGARIAAKAGVIGDVPAGATFAGYPAVERVRWLRGQARTYRPR